LPYAMVCVSPRGAGKDGVLGHRWAGALRCARRGGGSGWLRCGAAGGFRRPSAYLILVDTAVYAELGSAQVHGLVQVSVVGAGLDIGDLGKQVGSARGDIGQLGDGCVVLVGAGLGSRVRRRRCLGAGRW
jgi:hypothetical protein